MGRFVLNVLLHPTSDVDLVTSIAALAAESEGSEVILAPWGVHHVHPTVDDGLLMIPNQE